MIMFHVLLHIPHTSCTNAYLCLHCLVDSVRWFFFPSYSWLVPFKVARVSKSSFTLLSYTLSFHTFYVVYGLVSTIFFDGLSRLWLDFLLCQTILLLYVIFYVYFSYFLSLYLCQVACVGPIGVSYIMSHLWCILGRDR